MNELQNQINELRTLKKSYSDLVDKIDNLPSGGGSLALEQFFGLPAALPEGYEFMTAEEVCSTLEEIMTTMDIDLTPEQAKEITNNTLNKG